MPIVVLSPIKHFRIADAEKLEIGGGITIYNMPHPYITGLLDQNFQIYLGKMGLEEIKQSQAIAVLLNDSIEPNAEVEAEEQLKFHLEVLKIGINGFDSFLWFAKDGSACASVFYGHCYKRDLTFGINTVVQSIEIYSNCQAEHKDTIYTVEEIKLCLAILNNYVEMELNAEYPGRFKNLDELKEFVQRNDLQKEKEYNNYTRIRRALEFIKSARTVHFMPAKIGAYMSFLEALFSDGPEAVNYKVSERAACYLFSDPQRRLEVFEKIKGIYGIRSKYVHGDKFDNKHLKQDAISNASKTIDDIARTIMTKAIVLDSHHFLKKEEIDSTGKKVDQFALFLKQIVLGNSEHQTMDS